jgi:hypothetical protein
MLEPASCIFFHVDNFLHVSPLKQCRWFFSKLWQPISCGIELPSDNTQDCHWIITNIVDTSNQSICLRDTKRRKRPIQFILHPNTSVLFTYTSYRIVICLEINRAIYSIRSDGGTAADEMINSLITMLEEINKTLQTQEHISSVYVTVIAHHSELNLTYSLWQKEILQNKKNQNQNVFIQEDLLPSNFFALVSKKVEDLTFQRDSNPCFLSGGDTKQWSGADGMNMISICDGIFFHLNILPSFACPIAVLISPGVVEVPIASLIKSFAKANISFHVLLVTLSSDTQPLGCVPEIDNLRVLAESSGGSFETISSATKQNLESIGQIFIRPFYACRTESSMSSSSSLTTSCLKMYESRLHGYQLHGLTLEHLVASRLVEGYSLIAIVTDSGGGGRGGGGGGGFGGGGGGSSSSSPYHPNKNFFLSTEKTCVHIRLEKHLTKVSSITYIVSFFTDKYQKQQFPISRRPKSEGNVGKILKTKSRKSEGGGGGGINKKGATWSGVNQEMDRSYGTGILSIEIICQCPQKISISQSQLQSSQSHQETNSTITLLLNETRAIFDYDHRISLILKIRGMPGYVPQASSSPLLSSDGIGNISNDMINPENMMNTSIDQHKQQHKKTLQDILYRQSLILNQFILSNDVLENLCSLNEYQEAHLFLMSSHPTNTYTSSASRTNSNTQPAAAVTSSSASSSSLSSDLHFIQMDNEIRTKLFQNLRKISPQVKVYSLSGMKWLCLANASPLPPSSPHVGDESGHQEMDADPDEVYDLYLIELYHSDSNYLTIKFSSLGNCPHDVNPFMTLEIVVNNIQATLLHSHQIYSIRLNRNLSSLSTGLSSSSSSRQNQLTFCYLHPIFNFYEINLFPFPQLLESYLSDFKKKKLSLGFHFSSLVTGTNNTSTSSSTTSSSTTTICKLHFSTILSTSPSGMKLDSVFQCCVECSDEGIFISYFLEPSYDPILSSTSSGTQDPFQLTREINIPLGQSTDEAIETLESNTTAALTTAQAAAAMMSNQQISDLLENLLQQDALLFDYYFAMTSVYNSSSTSTTKTSPTNPFQMTHDKDQSIEIHANYWHCLQSYSYTRKFFLPALTYPEDDDMHATSSSSSSSPLKSKLNKPLLDLLHLSLHDMNLSHVNIIDKENLSFQSDYIFCVSLETGIMIIEVNSHSLVNELKSDQPEACTPTLDVTTSSKRNFFSFLTLEANSSTTDEESEPNGGGESNSTPPTSKSLERFCSMEGTEDGELSCQEMKIQDPLTNSISIHYRFVSIPLEACANDNDSHHPHPIIRTFRPELPAVIPHLSCISPTSADLMTHVSSSVENPVYNQHFIDMNQRLQQSHGINFSRIVYTNLLLSNTPSSSSSSHPQNVIQSCDLQRAVSYCTPDSIEMEVEISYRLKKSLTNSFHELTDTVDVPLYQITLGKYLQPVPNSDCFLFVSTETGPIITSTSPTKGTQQHHHHNGDDHLFHLSLHNDLQIYNRAVFIKLFLIYKNRLKNINQEFAIYGHEINTDNFFAQLFQNFSLLSDDEEEKFDETMLFGSSASDDNISLKLEIYSAGYHERGDGGGGGGGGAGGGSHSNEREYNEGGGDGDASGGGGGGGSGENEVEAKEGLKEIINTLTFELETLINYDTLFTLLVLPEVTRENIVLVQHCLRSTRHLCQATYSIDFLFPPSNQGAVYIEKVSQSFEEELLVLNQFKKIGDIIYARQWTMTVNNNHQDREGLERKDENITIPCWILLTISQTTLLDGTGLVDSMQVISMEVSVVLFTIGDYRTRQDQAMDEIKNKLQVTLIL